MYEYSYIKYLFNYASRYLLFFFFLNYTPCGCPRIEEEAKGPQHGPEDRGGS